ncbi:hypothetical protein Bbelb_040070 [Branchiostoma belcheri]|nr:hypothetical protein Bbelb_040070 [Branchiostoma belcheri]
MAPCPETVSRKRSSVLLLVLVLVSVCTARRGVSRCMTSASDYFCPPQCEKASQPLPLVEQIRFNLYWPLTKLITFRAWTVCEVANNETIAVPNVIPCIKKYAAAVAVTGYPLGILSAKTTEGICNGILALVKCDITDIEDNVLARLSNLHTLALDFNKLTHIRQNWFSGLEGLNALSLSNNKIVRVDAGSFMDLGLLRVLNLQNNQIQTVDPDSFSGLQNLAELRLESNNIPQGAFQYLHELRDLTLGGNITFLDGEMFWGLRYAPSLLRVVGKKLGRVRDTVVRDAAWSLSLHNHMDEREPHHIRRQDVSLTISDYFLCITHDPSNNKQAFGWAYNLSTYHDPRSVTIENTSCGLPDFLLTKIKSQADSVVLLKTGSSDQHTHPDDSAQCRQGWEHNGGLTVALQAGLRLRLTTSSERNATIRAFALTLDRTTQNTSTNSSDTEGNLKTFIQTNVTNITCFVLANGNTSRLILNVSRVEMRYMYNKTCSGSDHCPSFHETSILKNQTQIVLKSEHLTTTSAASATQVSTILNRPAPDDITIYAVILTVPVSGLVLVYIVVMLKRLLTLGKKNDRARIVPHAKSGRPRSASLPTISQPHSVVPHRQLVSCRSLPTTLTLIEPNYSEIPDDTAHAHHTYWEIQDGGMSDVTRSASLTELPARSLTRREEREDTVSCQSLPAALTSTEPTYYNIPDSDNDDAPLPFYGIAVDLTLPTVMGQGENRSIYQGKHSKRSRHLSLRKTRYGRSKSHRVTFYGKAAETSREHGSLGRSSRRLQQTSRRHTAVYGRSKSRGVTFYGKALDVPRKRDTNAKPPGCTSQSTHGQVHPNIPVQKAPIARPTSWPWQIAEGHQVNTMRPASLTEVFNSTMGLHCENTPRQTSLTTTQTTYLRSGELINSRSWPLRGQSTRLSLPSLRHINGTSQNEEILTNTYKPLGISHNAQFNTEPEISTVPNTYWPWEIGRPLAPQKRASLTSACRETQLSEAPSQINTYWPWEITTGSP